MRKREINDLILDTIKTFMIEKNYIPSRREIGKKLNIPHSTIIQKIKEMEQKGLVECVGRAIITEDIKIKSVPILHSLSNPNHIYDKANIRDYIFISKQLYKCEGEIAMLTIHDNSMQYANINIGNLLVVHRQKYAEYGQIVLVLSDNKYFLRRYYYDEKLQKAALRAESPDDYPIIENFEIRAISLSVVANIS